MNNIRVYNSIAPIIDKSAYVDNSAIIIGQVKIGANCSIWPNSVIRGDVNYITIGDNTNIQDLTTLHVTHHQPPISIGSPLIIGANVTVGHNCCLHAATIKDNVLIGMGTIILDNALVDNNCLIGAGSLVTSNSHLEAGYLYMGRPVKKIRQLTTNEIEFLQYSATHYVEIMRTYK
jgi:carbonic anhydrase/acetyltransferase-like protein (isoleucine patch superfamily)